MKEHPKVKINSARLADTREKRRKVACDKHAATQRFLYKNKRGYSTEGSTLLPSVLRPRLFGVGIAVGLATVIGITLNASDNPASAVSATLSVPEGISVNANPTTNNGFAESSNGAISVSTGNQMGYTLTIKAKDNNQLKNGSSVLNSISTNLTADQYKNGDYVNTWGMKPSSINSADNTSYVPGPNTSGVTLASTHASSNDAENYSLGIAAKIDSNTVAGNYTNTFTIAATANEATYTIKYNANGGSPTPATQSKPFDTETTVTIEGAAPTNSNGKDFLGWCTENPGDSDTCTGALIQPGGKFPLCKCDLNITLYAMYGTAAAKPGADGSDCMIERYVGKVYGGYCWMWQNLSGTYTLAKANSACPNGWHLPSQGDFQSLLDAIGSGAQLYQAGWSGSYWSSTMGNSSSAYRLYVDLTSAGIIDAHITNPLNVRCVAEQG